MLLCVTDEDPKIHPMHVQDLTGKSFCFDLAITSDNVTNGSDTFKVSEVWSGDYIQRIESISEPVSLIETMSSTLSGGDVSDRTLPMLSYCTTL